MEKLVLRREENEFVGQRKTNERSFGNLKIEQ
jgi:hypothetical protein